MSGRCAGCGRVESTARSRRHVRDCPDFAALHVSNPDAAIDPELEFRRYVDEQRGDDRAQRRQDMIDEVDRRRAAQRDRWAVPPDLLGDDEVG